MAPERFSKLGASHVLAFYDVDDKGHPVSVGHRLRKALPRCRYFEFSSAAQGEWDAARLPFELLSLVRDEWPSVRRWRGAGKPVEALPDLTRVAGGWRAWSLPLASGELAAIGASLPSPSSSSPPPPGGGGGGDGGLAPSARRAFGEGKEAEDEEDDGEDGGVDDKCWRIVLEAGSGALQYEHVATGRRVVSRPPASARIVSECVPSLASARGGGGRPRDRALL